MVWGGVIYFMLLKVSVDTLKHFAQRVSQLYEQGADEDRIWEYVRHWCRWVRASVILQIIPSLLSWQSSGPLLFDHW